ncbi:hypothetical protein BDZ88DRAFT_433979 [Geranomyces variabilis]|nr:hypothetical protein BDZ88DRAFT_433979 [Geranomyces variabilis]
MTAPMILTSHFDKLAVPTSDDTHDIRSFVESQGRAFKAGLGYYELTKAETISARGEMVVQDIASGQITSVPADIRAKMGLKDGTTKKSSLKVKIDPADHEGFRIFVKSSSYNRKLPGGSRLLYKKNEVDASLPAAAPVPAPSSAGRTTRSSTRASITAGSSTVKHSTLSPAPKRKPSLSGAAPAAAPTVSPPKRARRGASPVPAVSADPASPVPSATVKTAAAVETAASSSTGFEERPLETLRQILFTFDTTGSMYSCIPALKTSLENNIDRILTVMPNVQIALLSHGDYQDEGVTYLTRYQDFTSDKQLLMTFIRDRATNTHGYDFEEAYEYVLHQSRTELTWHVDAIKSMVVMGDAPPHDTRYHLNKQKLDWREEARLLNQAQIRVYAVQCLSWGAESDRFYRELANLTHGHHLRLAQFQAVPNFMIAIATNELGGQQAVTQLGSLSDEYRQQNGGFLTREFRQLFASLGVAAGGADGDASIAGLALVPAGKYQVINVDEDVELRQFIKNRASSSSRSAPTTSGPRPRRSKPARTSFSTTSRTVTSSRARRPETLLELSSVTESSSPQRTICMTSSSAPTVTIGSWWAGRVSCTSRFPLCQTLRLELVR